MVVDPVSYEGNNSSSSCYALRRSWSVDHGITRQDRDFVRRTYLCFLYAGYVDLVFLHEVLQFCGFIVYTVAVPLENSYPLLRPIGFDWVALAVWDLPAQFPLGGFTEVTHPRTVYGLLAASGTAGALFVVVFGTLFARQSGGPFSDTTSTVVAGAGWCLSAFVVGRIGITGAAEVAAPVVARALFVCFVWAADTFAPRGILTYACFANMAGACVSILVGGTGVEVLAITRGAGPVGDESLPSGDSSALMMVGQSAN